MNNVHPIFQSLIDSIDPNKQPENTIPTNHGHKTVPEIMDHLMWSSYRANRGYGCTHEQLVKFGIGNDAMKERYELERRAADN